MQDEVENLIVGSGPAGCTIARALVDNGRHVRMLEAGAQHSARRGEHLKNAYVYQRNLDAFTHVIKGLSSSFSTSLDQHNEVSLDPYVYRPRKRDRGSQNPAQRSELNLPAAAAAYGVGSMFTHWTSNTPRPFGRERITQLDNDTLNALFDQAEALLLTSNDIYSASIRHKVLLE